MQKTPHLIRRTLATATVACACLSPLVGSATANAALVPIQSWTIPSSQDGCPVPGTGTLRPCIEPAPGTVIPKLP